MGGMELLRTPEDRFVDLPDFPWQPAYIEVPAGPGDETAVRVAVIDEGPRDAPVVLAVHGEPSWSFLYRHVAARLLQRGLRVVVPDLVGFGRSDKPAEITDHTYGAHLGWLRATLDALELRRVVLLCQDWGGLLGLPLVAEDPGRFAGVVAANTGLPDGSLRMPPEWQAFRDFVEGSEDLPVGWLVSRAVALPMDPRVQAAYDAPFPSPEFKAGPRAMPGLIPQSPDMPQAAENVAAWDSLRRYTAPFVTAFSDGDPITRGADGLFQARVPGAAGQPHVILAGGGHFLQEDVPGPLADVVADLVDRL